MSFTMLVQDGHRNYDNSAEKEIWLHLNCETSFENQLSKIKINNIEDYSAKSKHSIPLGKDLIPYLEDYKYDEVAEKCLEKYYPEALDSNNKEIVDHKKLAENLGLDVRDTFIK